ncbi:unnamed protein product [Caenorhabditis angaria]|uniref:Uncharacterized protein n=1 Tax=Caenorhabditis angaria TaxID=860376 RepID=A0A9P1J1E5_9PELO|nr:unnamed protein product [Caenorhabditis angaria]
MSSPFAAPQTMFNPTNQATDDPIVSSRCCCCTRKCPSIFAALFGAILILAAIATVLIFTFSTSKLSSSCNDHKTIGRPKFRTTESDFPFQQNSISTRFSIPPNVSTCPGFGFICNDVGEMMKVIPKAKRCDGKFDCSNKSDEQICDNCQTIFQCNSKLIGQDESGELKTHFICLTASQLCDGVQDCPDGSDEKFWCKANCSADEFKCPGQNLCLPKNAKCDGIADCNDMSDEKDCTSCEARAHKCGEVCVPMSEICDGIAQCDDGSDEKGCDCDSCSGSDKALCDDGTCILRYQVCDGKRDCSNGMDEKDCPGSCMVNESAMKKRITCSDGIEYTEEEACSGEFQKCYSNCPGTCDAFLCPIDLKCISRKSVCDGYADCSDGADERNCSCIDVEETQRFNCDRKCINISQKCDGIVDCIDVSDEYNCEKCAAGTFSCSTDKTCLPQSTRCDGVLNCSDGSDEKDCICDECVGAHSTTYMCDGSPRCFLIDEVCAPNSICPNATNADEAYCDIQMSRIKSRQPWRIQLFDLKNIYSIFEQQEIRRITQFKRRKSPSSDEIRNRKMMQKKLESHFDLPDNTINIPTEAIEKTRRARLLITSPEFFDRFETKSMDSGKSQEEFREPFFDVKLTNSWPIPIGFSKEYMEYSFLPNQLCFLFDIKSISISIISLLLIFSNLFIRH